MGIRPWGISHLWVPSFVVEMPRYTNFSFKYAKRIEKILCSASICISSSSNVFQRDIAEVIIRNYFIFVGNRGEHGWKIGIRRDFQDDASRRSAQNTAAKKYGHSRSPVILRVHVHNWCDRSAGLDPRQTHNGDVHHRCEVIRSLVTLRFLSTY